MVVRVRHCVGSSTTGSDPSHGHKLEQRPGLRAVGIGCGCRKAGGYGLLHRPDAARMHG